VAPVTGHAGGPVVVTGAAGKTGRAVVAALAARDVPVLALVHRPEQARAGIPGATASVAVDLADADAVHRVLAGTSAVYLIAPNMHPDEPALLEPVIAGCEGSGPARVVYHSVLHPYAPAMPHHLDKARVEARLHDSPLDWTILQPTSYFENVLGAWDSVRDAGVWPLPYSATAPFTPVALDDVAEVAAAALTNPAHRFATYELAGPERLSTDDMARIAAEVLGHEVTVTVDRDAWREGPGRLLDTDARERLEAMFDYYDRHGLCGNPTVLAALLGRTPQSWRSWAHR
jgi:uncharacterized protein YbjT (DUF2867 family)